MSLFVKAPDTERKFPCPVLNCKAEFHIRDKVAREEHMTSDRSHLAKLFELHMTNGLIAEAMTLARRWH
ncbi:MAG: hypothetical protein UX94_C0011G0044 [Parcubacteria group bacterium GW2011_GWA2_47_21]|nr:MAG: hypothetical protein UX94_C0011G0044 [Parcubacteria group bacterium GW2011_GWA2_47_21]